MSFGEPFFGLSWLDAITLTVIVRGLASVKDVLQPLGLGGPQLSHALSPDSTL